MATDFSDDVQSFIFGGNTGLTVEQLRRRQAIAAAVASQKRAFPKTLGEGMTYFGEAIGDRMQEERLRKAENEMQTKNNQMARDAAAVPKTYGTPNAPQRVAPSSTSPPPTAAPPPGNTSSRSPDDYGWMVPQNTAFNSAPDPNVRAAIAQYEPDETMRAYYNHLSSREQPTPGGVSPTGAAGPFQFTRGTGKDYGLYGADGDRRGDPAASVQAVQQFTRDNIDHFAAVNGRAPTLPELGVMHQQGRTAGASMIAGTGNAPTGNLSVNGIDPNTDAAGAVAKIKGFYGLPDLPVPDGYAKPKTVRDKIAEADLERQTGTPQEVAQANPTLAGEDTPPATGGSAEPPIRLAALDTGVVSDAPPPGRAMPNIPGADAAQPPAPPAAAPVVEPENPPTPSDIKPAPQLAQAGGGPVMLPPASYAPPPGQSALAPLQMPSPQTMPHPGAPPEVPTPLPMSQAQAKWLGIMNSPYAGENLKGIAKQQYDAEDKYRTDLQAQREADYTHLRGRYEAKVDAYDKFNREAGDRNFKQTTDFLATTKTQAELEKMLFEAGEPRQQALIKGALENQKLRKEVDKPDTAQVRGTQFERPYTAPGQPEKPYALPPGLPGPEEKMTAEQAAAVGFYKRVMPDLLHVEQNLQHGLAMTDPEQVAKDRIPVAGNYLVSPEYRQARDAIGNWAGGFMKMTSGSAVTPSEAARNLPAFVPRPGDTAQELLDKSRRRRDFTEAAAAVSGEDGMKKIREQRDAANEEQLFKEHAREPAVPLKPGVDPRLLPPGTTIITPDGRELQVPRRKGSGS